MRYEEAIAKHAPLSPYEQGLVEGLRMYAVHKDGHMYVGAMMTLLGDAIDKALTEHRERVGAVA